MVRWCPGLACKVHLTGSDTMWNFLIGAGASTGFLILAHHVKTRCEPLRWWGWSLALSGVLYGAFVLAMVVAFLEEGTPKAALVQGVVFGLPAVLWGVVLARFVLRRRA